MVKDWLGKVKRPDSEDRLLKRKLAVEIRGIPLNCWSEDNFQLLIKDIGTWSWWNNKPITSSSLENPKIAIYSSSLEGINMSITLKSKVWGIKYCC